MDLDQLFEEQRPLPGLIGIERVMVCYCGFTFLLLGVLGSVMGNWWEPVAWRVGILAVTFLLYRFYQKHPCNLTYIIRVFFQLALLSYWYPDIYHFAKLMPNTDHLFALADQTLFGFQPALQFSQTLHGTFWNELFNLGYLLPDAHRRRAVGHGALLPPLRPHHRHHPHVVHALLCHIHLPAVSRTTVLLP